MQGSFLARLSWWECVGVKIAQFYVEFCSWSPT
jgi:hypothetical protein